MKFEQRPTQTKVIWKHGGGCISSAVIDYKFSLNHFLTDSDFSLGGRLKVSNEVSTFLGFLQTSKNHFSTGDVFLGVFQIFKQGVLVPGDSLWFVGISVDVTCSLASFATKETIQVGASLVFSTSLNCMALSTALNKELQKNRIII